MYCHQFTTQVLENWEQKKVRNPKTNRFIKFWTTTFSKLEKECNEFNNCHSIRGLRNVSVFSCYLDSVLFLLLAIPNRYMDKAILHKPITDHTIGRVCYKRDDEKNVRALTKIQDEMQKLCFQIRNGKYVQENTCSNFLRILRDYCKESSYPKFFEKEQRDPRDFLEFVFDIFNVDLFFNNQMILKHTYRKKHYTPILTQFTSSSIVPHAHCVWNVPYDQLKPNLPLKRTLWIKESCHFSKEAPFFFEGDVDKRYPILYRQTIRKYKSLPPFLIFDINRVDVVSGHFNEANLIPDSKIQHLDLYGIIVHRGYGAPPSMTRQHRMGEIGSGHYVAYFKCQQTWYLYDDLASTIMCVGTYDNLLKKTDACRKGILYFYSR